MSVAGQIIELDASKMYVYRVQSALRCYVTFYAEHWEVIQLIKNYVSIWKKGQIVEILHTLLKIIVKFHNILLYSLYVYSNPRIIKSVHIIKSRTQ